MIGNTVTSSGASKCSQFIRQYNLWRQIYGRAGQPARDQPIWENGRLHLRVSYPYPGWTAYVLAPRGDEFDIMSATTERRNEPHERLLGFFSHPDDLGKYILWNIGEDLRVDCRIAPLTPAWREAGLDPRVSQTTLGEYESKFELKDNPARYFVLKKGGVQPENRLLPLTYDGLDALLLDGMPESITSEL